jgi:hypothetical protein
MSANVDSLSLFISGVGALAGSGLLAALFTFSLALLLFCSLLNAVVYAVYLTFVLWTAHERATEAGETGGDTERGSSDGDQPVASAPAFEFGAVRNSLALVVAQGVAALAQLGALSLSIGARAISLLFNNLVLFVLLLLLFVFAVAWASSHDVLYRAGAQFTNAFVLPVARPTVVSIANTLALIGGAILPLSNFLRQMQVSVVSETLIDALICGRQQIRVVGINGGIALKEFGTATSAWLIAPNTLDISPDYLATGRAFGAALASLDAFGRCMCDAAAEVVVEPFANVVRGEPFAVAFDSAINAPLSLVTRTVIGTVVRSFERGAVQRPPIDPPIQFAAAFIANVGAVGDGMLSTVTQIVFSIVGLATGECTIDPGVGVECNRQFVLLANNGVSPVPGLLSGVAVLYFDAAMLQPAHYVARIIVNADIVFFTLDGVRFFNIESTVGEAALRGWRTLLGGTLGWVKALLGAVASFLDSVPALQGRPGDAPALLALVANGTIGDSQRSALNRRFKTEADVISSSLRFVGSLLDSLFELSLRSGVAVHNVVSLVIDAQPGTIYGAIESGGDVLLFSKRLFDQVGDVPRVCVLPRRSGLIVPSGEKDLFLRQRRLNPTVPSTCPAHIELREYCRFVFRQLIDGVFPRNTSIATALLPQPPSMDGVSFDNFPEIVLADARRCARTVPGCTPIVSFPETPRAERVLKSIVAVPAALDIAIAGGLVGVPELRDFFGNLAAPLVPIVIAVLEPVAHLRELLTTRYAACVDVEGALSAVEEFVRALTNALRAIADAVPGAVGCDPNLGASDTRIFCAIPQGVDSAVGGVVEVVMLGWRTLVTLLRLDTTGGRTLVTLRSALDLTRLEALVRDTAFGVVSVVGGLVPESVRCAGADEERAFCCDVRIFLADGDDDDSNDPGTTGRFSRQPNDPDACASHARSVFPRGLGTVQRLSATILPRSLSPRGACPIIVGFLPFVDLTRASAPTGSFTRIPAELGCCAEFAPGVRDQPGAKARLCTDAANHLECKATPGHVFSPFRSCSDAFANECPPSPVSSSASVIVVDAVALILSRAVFLFVQIPIGFATELAELLVSASADPANLLDERAFERLFESVIRPIVELGVDILVQGARVFECLGAFDLHSLILLIADLFDRIAIFAIDTIADLVLLVVTTVAGIIELLIPPNSTTLLQRALRQILKFFVDIAVAIFGETFICGIQDLTCGAIGFIDLFGAEIAFNSVMFAGLQCREFDCCLLGREPDSGSISKCKGPLTGVPATCRSPGIDCSQYCETAANCVLEQRKRFAGEPLLFANATGAFADTIDLVEQQQLKNADLINVAVGTGPDAPLLRAAGHFMARMAHLGGHARQGVAEHWFSMTKEALAQFDDYKREAVRRDVVHIEALVRPSAKHYNKRSRASSWRDPDTNMATRTDTLHSTARSIMVRSLLALRIVTHIWLETSDPRAVSERVQEIARPAHQHSAEHSLHKRSVRFGAAQRTSNATGADSVGISPGVDESGLYVVRQELALASVRAHVLSHRASQFGALLWGVVASELEKPRQSRMRLALQRYGSTVAAPVTSAIEDIGELIALPECDNRTQTCTNCLVIDNLVFAATNGSRGVREFYPDRRVGYASYLERYAEILDTTLVDPAGQDTFLTPIKRVPWIGLRLARVRWAWQFDYSELASIIEGGSSGEPPQPSFESTQLAHQAAVGRPDLEISLFEMFGEPLRPAFGALERTVALLRRRPNTAAIARLIERYVLCDYTGSLQCRGTLTELGLFDATANVLLLYVAPLLLLGVVLPGGAAAFVPSPLSGGGAMVAYYLTLWLAYGASPLCTLASFIFGLVGFPTCLPIDLATLISETLPQCAHVPISLIDPSELAQAGRTLCSSVDVPLLLNCAPAAGFLNGFDNLFYTLEALFGPAPNAAIAKLAATAVPPIGAIAALYTPAYVEQLGDLGAVCNLFTMPNVIVLQLLIAGFAAVAFLLVAAALSLAAAAAGILYATLSSAAVMFGQIANVFVGSVVVRRITVSEPRRFGRLAN